MACLCPTTLDSQQELLRWLGKPPVWPPLGFGPRWFSHSVAWSTYVWFRLHTACCLGFLRMNILREPSRTHMASYDPPLEFTQLHSIIVYWSKTVTRLLCSQVNTYPDSICWEEECHQVSGHFSKIAAQNHWIWNEKEENTERDWTRDQGSHIEHPCLSLVSHCFSFQFHFFLSQTEIGIIRQTT